ncbi:guanine nucleotide exchange factor [Holotrichia oblita]|uniref:Guanine nucleotide exchange factor n=1 Tax=Holotrichia oblita TaxID=644536 RepID=A0ACB9T3F5_HOLOL|nr:guanine nucleotide exchange factor [Holotrichia oblita]
MNSPYNNIDITNTQLPDTPNNPTKVLDRLSTAGKNLRRLFSKNDLTKSLGRIAKRKSRTDLDNPNNSLDRGKTRSSSKLDRREDSSGTHRNSLTSQDSNSDQNSIDTIYEKQKLKPKAKSTFYLTDTIDISSNTDKGDCDRAKDNLSPVNQKSRNVKTSPVRPSVPPPPLPKSVYVNDSATTKADSRRSTSWYVESGLFKNSDNISNNKHKRLTASWYAEIGLYQSGPRSTPSTSSAENSGSGISNRNELDEVNYENTEEYHNLKNETEYNNSMDSFSSNETKMDNSSTVLSEDMQQILQEEPLYQFYNAAIVESICHEGTDWDSDGYEEITKNEENERQPRPSAMDLISTNGSNISLSRTLWCEIPEVKQSEVFKTLSIEQKKVQEAKFEMMTSEASYLNSLNVLMKHFMQNIYKCKTGSKEDMDILFGKIPQVRNCSEKLLLDLEKCWQDNILLQNICNIIHKHAEENFSVYVSYVENQVLLESTLKKLKESAEFRETLQRLETSMDCQALTLSSFLMLPMQRITRWPLLLDAVLKRLSSNEPEYLACQCALTTINKIANQCNEAARTKEREAEMKTIAHKIDFGTYKPPFNLTSEGRWLIKSGPVTQLLARGDDGKLTFGKKLIKKPLFIFLFNDLFIVSKYQSSEDNYLVLHYCARNMIEVNVDIAPNLPVKDTNNLIFLTILENQQEKLVEILFSCNSTTDKERWFNALAPAKSDDPDETLYERWDCPQVTVIYNYNSHQPDELNIAKGDIIYVVRKMSDGE